MRPPPGSDPGHVPRREGGRRPRRRGSEQQGRPGSLATIIRVGTRVPGSSRGVCAAASGPGAGGSCPRRQNAGRAGRRRPRAPAAQRGSATAGRASLHRPDVGDELARGQWARPRRAFVARRRAPTSSCGGGDTLRRSDGHLALRELCARLPERGRGSRSSAPPRGPRARAARPSLSSASSPAGGRRDWLAEPAPAPPPGRAPWACPPSPTLGRWRARSPRSGAQTGSGGVGGGGNVCAARRRARSRRGSGRRRN